MSRNAYREALDDLISLARELFSRALLFAFLLGAFCAFATLSVVFAPITAWLVIAALPWAWACLHSIRAERRARGTLAACLKDLWAENAHLRNLLAAKRSKNISNGNTPNGDVQ